VTNEKTMEYLYEISVSLQLHNGIESFDKMVHRVLFLFFDSDLLKGAVLTQLIMTLGKLDSISRKVHAWQ